MTPEQFIENDLVSKIKTIHPVGICLCRLSVEAAIYRYKRFNYVNLDDIIKAVTKYIKMISAFDGPLTARQFSERYECGEDVGRKLLKKTDGIYRDARGRPHLFFIEPITEAEADEIRLVKNGR